MSRSAFLDQLALMFSTLQAEIAGFLAHKTLADVQI